MAKNFKNYFSSQSTDYSLFRPSYPEAMIKWLVDQSRAYDLAWDGATGSGQTARQLAPYFKQVIATDASQSQIDNATPCEGVEYRVMRSESSGLQTGTVDLITIAQAAHWFDMKAFNEEAARILKPGGFIALWCYELMEIDAEIDELVQHLYSQVLGRDYWPPERQLVEEGYQSLLFPFDEVSPPRFDMKLNWSFDHLIGYLGTWSAVQRYKDEKGEDPVGLIAKDLQRAWKKQQPVKSIRWPVSMRAGSWS